MKKIIIMPILVLLLVSACSSGNYENPDTEEPNTDDITNPKVTSTVTPTLDPIQTIISEMTLEEKIGQLFIVSFRQNNVGEPVLSVDGAIQDALNEYKVGGVILFAENIKSIAQTISLINELQKTSNIPLFMAVDEEGGLVSRITKSPQMHATVFPNNDVIGKAKNPDIARDVASAISEEIASLGFNMNFAPVADINTNPDNPVIGVRAYGNDAQIVSSMVAAAVTGIQSKSVCAVLKHFPGHGDTTTDSHYGTATVSHTKDRLFDVELLPFIKGIEIGADAVMTAHILTPEIPGDNVPATVKYEILTEILRNEIGFEGLIITDALNMGAITDNFTADEVAVKAIIAGADILLMPEDLKKAYSGVKEACENGTISADRINESVERILKIKFKRGLFDEPSKKDPEKILGCTEHKKIVEKISKK